MRLKFVLALVFAFLPFCAHADDGVIKDIEFYEADIYELQDRFPYLAEIAKDQEKFVQEHPKARPLIIQTATITPGGSGRNISSFVKAARCYAVVKAAH